MGAARESDQADFDLERFIDMFDEALTSKDPRVVETLRKLMMIVALTKPETRNPIGDRTVGPLRRIYEDVRHVNQRMAHIEDIYRQLQNEHARNNVWQEPDKYSMVAARQMAQQIDNDVMRKLSAQTAIQVNGGVWPKGTLK